MPCITTRDGTGLSLESPSTKGHTNPLVTDASGLAFPLGTPLRGQIGNDGMDHTTRIHTMKRSL